MDAAANKRHASGARQKLLFERPFEGPIARGEQVTLGLREETGWHQYSLIWRASACAPARACWANFFACRARGADGRHGMAAPWPGQTEPLSLFDVARFPPLCDAGMEASEWEERHRLSATEAHAAAGLLVSHP